MVPPLIKVSEETLENLDQLKVPYELQNVDLQRNYIQLPSGLYFSRKKKLLGRNFDQTVTDLRSQGNLFVKMSEFADILIYTRDNHSEIYEEITAVRSPKRSEWIGARFKERDGKMYMVTRDGEEELDPDTLMEDRTPGISIKSWLENPTTQGFPRKSVAKGNLCYFQPRDGGVAWFYAGSDWACLCCYRIPSNSVADLGVRLVRRE